MTNLIALDLELEQPKTGPQTPDSHLDLSKIIQVGWVVFETQPDGFFRILKEQREYVNIGVPLSAFIKALTKISDEDVASGGTLLEAYAKLKEDQKLFNTSRVVRQWGSGDMEQIRMELENETRVDLLMDADYKWEFGQAGMNVKHLYQTYAMVNGLNTSGGLSKCLGRCDLSWLGRGKHDALNDAINTAQIYSYFENSMRLKDG